MSHWDEDDDVAAVDDVPDAECERVRAALSFCNFIPPDTILVLADYCVGMLRAGSSHAELPAFIKDVAGCTSREAYDATLAVVTAFDSSTQNATDLLPPPPPPSPPPPPQQPQQPDNDAAPVEDKSAVDEPHADSATEPMDAPLPTHAPSPPSPPPHPQPAAFDLGALFAVPSTAASSRSAPPASSLGVCRHYASTGECFIYNCPYEHATHGILCRFFFTPDGCVNDNACRFSHDVALYYETMYATEDDGAESEAVEHAEVEAGAEAEAPLDLADFPVLGSTGATGSADAGAPPRAGAYARTAQSFSSRLAFATLVSRFPSLEPGDIAAALQANDYSAQRAGAWLMARFGVTPATAATVRTRAASDSGRDGSRLAPAAAAASASARGAARQPELARALAAKIPAFETGAKVTSAYAAARADAELSAKQRNAHFAAAQARSGRGGASAAAVSAAMAANAAMRREQDDALLRIFNERNSADARSSSGSSGSSSWARLHKTAIGLSTWRMDISPLSCAVTLAGSREFVPLALVDFHGLHPDEACGMVELALERAHMAGGQRVTWWAFITGAGSHSQRRGKGGGSVHAAVEELLLEWHEEYYTHANTDGVLPGCILVHRAA